jgi:hypothetical protein
VRSARGFPPLFLSMAPRKRHVAERVSTSDMANSKLPVPSCQGTPQEVGEVRIEMVCIGGSNQVHTWQGTD